MLCFPIRLGEQCTLLSLLLRALKSDLGSHLYLETRKTHLISEYVCFSDNYRLLLLEMWSQILPYKTGGERDPWVSLSEARKSFHLWPCYSPPVKIIDNELYFIFLFFFLFNFLFLEQLGLGCISHAVTSVTSWWHSHKTDHRTWENEVEDSRTKWCHTVWTTHADLMLYSWSFRVGCTVASTDHR